MGAKLALAAKADYLSAMHTVLGILVGIGVGLPEVLIILLVVLLIFGPSKLPALGEGIGKMLRGFKKEMKSMDEDKQAAAAAAAGERAIDDRPEIDVTPKGASDPKA
jgi:sec-independent protein translocase protein TatA